MLARIWKRRWLLLCLERQARKASMERPVAKPMSSNQNLRVSWKPVNLQDCVWKNLYRNIMRTVLQEKGTIHCNTAIWHTNLFPMLQAAAKAAVDKKWEKLEKISGVGHNKSQKEIRGDG